MTVISLLRIQEVEGVNFVMGRLRCGLKHVKRATLEIFYIFYRKDWLKYQNHLVVDLLDVIYHLV